MTVIYAREGGEYLARTTLRPANGIVLHEIRTSSVGYVHSVTIYGIEDELRLEEGGERIHVAEGEYITFPYPAMEPDLAETMLVIAIVLTSSRDFDNYEVIPFCISARYYSPERFAEYSEYAQEVDIPDGAYGTIAVVQRCWPQP